MGSGSAIGLAIKKYGKENFAKVIMSQHETRNEALLAEALYVPQELVDDSICYNLCQGGLGGEGYSPSVETRKKLSNALKGHLVSIETRKKIAKSLTGGTRSLESRQKMRERALQREPISDATRQKMSVAKKKQARTPAARKRVSLSTIGRLWWNNGTQNKFCKDCPGDEYVRGRIKWAKSLDKKPI